MNTNAVGGETTNSSGDATANMNVYTTRSTTTFAQCAREATKVGEIT